MKTRSKSVIDPNVYIIWCSRGLFAYHKVKESCRRIKGPESALFYLLTMKYHRRTRERLFTAEERSAWSNAALDIYTWNFN